MLVQIEENGEGLPFASCTDRRKSFGEIDPRDFAFLAIEFCKISKVNVQFEVIDLEGELDTNNLASASSKEADLSTWIHEDFGRFVEICSS